MNIVYKIIYSKLNHLYKSITFAVPSPRIHGHLHQLNMAKRFKYLEKMLKVRIIFVSDIWQVLRNKKNKCSQLDPE